MVIDYWLIFLILASCVIFLLENIQYFALNQVVYIFRERLEVEEKERERQWEEVVNDAYRFALTERATELREELERRYQAAIDERVKERINEVEREMQRADEEKHMIKACSIPYLQFSIMGSYIILFVSLFCRKRSVENWRNWTEF